MTTQINRLSEILGFKVPVDGFVTAALGSPIIDIIALEEKLQRKFKYAGSMNNFMKSEFGEEALSIIENNIPS